jgi:hypothetical protein
MVLEKFSGFEDRAVPLNRRSVIKSTKMIERMVFLQDIGGSIIHFEREEHSLFQTKTTWA